MFFVHGPSKDSVFTCTMLKLSQVIHLPRDISYHTLTWRGSYIYIYTQIPLLKGSPKLLTLRAHGFMLVLLNLSGD